MLNQRIEDNGITGTGTANCNIALSDRFGVLDSASVFCHQATDQSKSKQK